MTLQGEPSRKYAPRDYLAKSDVKMSTHQRRLDFCSFFEGSFKVKQINLRSDFHVIVFGHIALSSAVVHELIVILINH